MKRFIGIIFIAFLFVSTACSRKGEPIVSPEFETLSSKNAIVEKAVKMSLLGRGWSILNHRPGRVEAQLRRDEGASVTIAVVYSGSKVSIQYVTSTNLLYGKDDKSGQTLIHDNYNRWVTFLESDIQKNVASLM